MNDPKNIIIIALSAIILFLGGYILGKKVKPEAPISPEIAKAYKRKVARQFGDHFKSLQACYLSYLDKNPSLKEGKVHLKFSVDDTGSISDITILKNEFNDSAISTCLSDQMHAIKLLSPPEGAGKTFEHSFVFKSEETLQKEMEERKNLFPKTLPMKADQ